MVRETLLLVNPHIEDFAAYDHFSRPLGLALLAAHLERVFDVVCVDALVRDPGRAGRADGTGPFRAEIIEKPDVYRDVPRRYRRYGMDDGSFRERLAAIGRPRAALVTSVA